MLFTNLSIFSIFFLILGSRGYPMLPCSHSPGSIYQMLLSPSGSTFQQPCLSTFHSIISKMVRSPNQRDYGKRYVLIVKDLMVTGQSIFQLVVVFLSSLWSHWCVWRVSMWIIFCITLRIILSFKNIFMFLMRLYVE